VTSSQPVESDRTATDDRTVTFTACKKCGTRSYPPLKWCVGCLNGDLETLELNKQAVVYASSVVHLGPAAFHPPYTLAYLDVDGLRVLARRPGIVDVAPGDVVDVAAVPTDTVFGIAGGEGR
jgi:uncharacterized OB-fold protein